MESCYMESCFISKKALDDRTLIQVTTVYTIIFIIGLIGNLVTCVVIRRHPMLKTHSSHYLLNLACADLVTLCVGLPFEVVMNWNQYPWPFPDFVCNLKALIAETTISVSILTILLFSIERYIAVCHPFIFVKMKPLRNNVHYFLIFTWVISIICAIPFAIHHRADFMLKDWPYTNNGQPVISSKMCMIAVMFDHQLLTTFKFLFHFSAIMFFVIPLSIIFILYVLISYHISSSRKGLQRSETIEDGHLRVTFILTAIILAFFVCYLPFQIQRLAFFYFDNSEFFSMLNQYVYFISGFLFYLATIINPILYNLVSTRFRKASREVIISLLFNQPIQSQKFKSTVKYTIASQKSRSDE
ncbi:unnamed protein product [Auanema sp. JU1783]|nr:unnamed protein product [Auanema sp. JU1783]